LSGVREFPVLWGATPDDGLHLRSEIMVEKLPGVPRCRLRAVAGLLDAAALHAVGQASPLVPELT
jgi:hypothetical protein